MRSAPGLFVSGGVMFRHINRRGSRWVLAAAVAVVPFVMHAAQLPSARAKTSLTALDRYVAAPDPNFTWKAVRDLPAEGVTAPLLHITSQKWLTEQEVERPLWTHWLTVIRPAKVSSDIGLLFITGGSLDRPAPTQPPAWLVEAAKT